MEIEDTPGGGLTMVFRLEAATMTRILVVDDEPQLLRALGTNLKARDYEVDLAPTGELALDARGAPPSRPRRPRPRTARDRRHRGDPGPPRLDAGPDHRALGAGGRARQGGSARRRRRRLRDEAVRHGRAPRPAAGRAAAGRAGRRDRRGRHARTSRSTSRPSGSPNAAGDVRLTPTEWEIVEILVRNPGKLITQRQLLHEVWGPQYSTETNYLRVYMAQIRRKLEPDPSRPRSFHHGGADGVPLRSAGGVTRRSETRNPPRGRVSDGAEGARTPDLLAASQTLSQLSYGPRAAGL